MMLGVRLIQLSDRAANVRALYADADDVLRQNPDYMALLEREEMNTRHDMRRLIDETKPDARSEGTEANDVVAPHNTSPDLNVDYRTEQDEAL